MMNGWGRLVCQIRGANSNSLLQWRPQCLPCYHSKLNFQSSVSGKCFLFQTLLWPTALHDGVIPLNRPSHQIGCYLHSAHTGCSNISKEESGTTAISFPDFVATGAVSKPTIHRNVKDRLVRSQDEDIQKVIDDNFDKIEELALALRCGVDEAKELVEKDTRLVSHFKISKVLATIEAVQEYGFTGAELLRNPPAFSLSIPTLISRLIAMEEVRCRRLYVLKYGGKRFREILLWYKEEMEVMGGFTSRETYLAVLIGCNEADIAELANQHDPVRTLPVKRLTKVFRLLQDHGFTSDEIRSNPELLGIQTNELSYRLDKIALANLLDKDKMIPLLRHLRRGAFESSLAGWIDDEEALDGHVDKRSYLEWMLNCSSADLERMYVSVPSLRKCRPKRWKEVLDILLDEMNLATETVLARPTVFLFSAKRLHFRHEILKDKDVIDPVSLVHELCLSAHIFTKKYQLELNQMDK